MERATIDCAGIVLIEGGQLLMIRRAHEPDRGRWSLPGGRCEPGESQGVAAAREALEETGLRVEVGAEIGRASIAGGSADYLVVNFAAVRVGGELAAGSDASEARFVSALELVGLDVSPLLLSWLEEHGVLERLGGS